MKLREAIARHVAKNAIGVDFDHNLVDRRNYLETCDDIISIVRRFLDHNLTEKVELTPEKQQQILNLIDEEHMP